MSGRPGQAHGGEGGVMLHAPNEIAGAIESVAPAIDHEPVLGPPLYDVDDEGIYHGPLACVACGALQMQTPEGDLTCPRAHVGAPSCYDRPCGFDYCAGCDVPCACGHRGCWHSHATGVCDIEACECENYVAALSVPAPEDIPTYPDGLSDDAEGALADPAPSDESPLVPPQSAEAPSGEPEEPPDLKLFVGLQGNDLAGVLIPTERPEGLLTIEQATEQVFVAYGVPRLGGASGDLGWSSFSAFQKCPYYWKRMYLDGVRAEQIPSPALEIGALLHTLLAIRYMRMIDVNYPITPEVMVDNLMGSGATVEVITEAKRLYEGYDFEYATDYLIPLAVEEHVVDPKTRESARFDLIAKIDKPRPGVGAGTYIVEHKTASRFDEATLSAWRNDGEILGQIMLWKRMKLDKKYGKLRGTIVNIVGKQKTQQFHRTIVPPQRWQLKQHARDLQVWHAQRMVCVAVGTFPRARANCVGRYGMCSQFTHCADRE